MVARTVRDVIGEPGTWPNELGRVGSFDMSGAMITAAFASGDQIAIQTNGSAKGITFATFHVPDAQLRGSIIAAMWKGRDVFAACDTEV
jgi:hypothetical protein